MYSRSAMLTLLAVFTISCSLLAYQLNDHPRIFVNKQSMPGVAARSKAGLSQEYQKIKAVADKAVAEGVARPEGRFRPPLGLVCAGICYLVERELGNEAGKYADVIKKYWGDASVLNLDGDGYFGFHGLLFDWIYDALTPAERVKFGDQLGDWLYWYTDTPEITLKNGGWWYNQTWGPAHLNTPNTRDGITPKLFVALGLAGAGTRHEEDARRYLDSWARRVPAECIPAFDESGGVWTESMGHGSYGPVVVIPWAFEAWRTATGEDLFQKCSPTSYLAEMTRWAVYLTVPFADHTAWIDDNHAADLGTFARIAPILASRYRDPVDNWISDRSAGFGRSEVPWNRFLSYDPSVKSSPPWEQDYPLAYLFKQSGHLYARSAWNDPNATWAFFGAGPKFEGHSRDDEGHFLIARKGWLALRSGSPGHNDWDYYAGGSLAFNALTIYNPDEQFRRVTPGESGGIKNENDGGMIRYVYTSHSRDDRAEIVAYRTTDNFTYAGADLTIGYQPEKAREVTRQFFYLRQPAEFFIIFDRVEATQTEFPKHWFLHIPGEPAVKGKETVIVPEHVFSYTGNLSAAWASDPAGEEGVLSTGSAHAYLTTLLPKGATLVKRGGEGYQFWGHPAEPTAQYNHVGRLSDQPPIVPWRLELGAPQGSLRNYFLNVIEVRDDDGGPSSVALVEKDGYEGVRITVNGQDIEISFAGQGKLTARVKSAGGAVETVEAWK